MKTAICACPLKEYYYATSTSSSPAAIGRTEVKHRCMPLARAPHAQPPPAADGQHHVLQQHLPAPPALAPAHPLPPAAAPAAACQLSAGPPFQQPLSLQLPAPQTGPCMRTGQLIKSYVTGNTQQCNTQTTATCIPQMSTVRCSLRMQQGGCYCHVLPAALCISNT